ncbi:MAG: hypothetical protein ACRDXB_20775, partial [Actinomycetes bacterium]
CTAVIGPWARTLLRGRTLLLRGRTLLLRGRTLWNDPTVRGRTLRARWTASRSRLLTGGWTLWDHPMLGSGGAMGSHRTLHNRLRRRRGRGYFRNGDIGPGLWPRDR